MARKLLDSMSLQRSHCILSSAVIIKPSDHDRRRTSYHLQPSSYFFLSNTHEVAKPITPPLPAGSRLKMTSLRSVTLRATHVSRNALLKAKSVEVFQRRVLAVE